MTYADVVTAFETELMELGAHDKIPDFEVERVAELLGGLKLNVTLLDVVETGTEELPKEIDPTVLVVAPVVVVGIELKFKVGALAEVEVVLVDRENPEVVVAKPLKENPLKLEACVLTGEF